MSRLLSAGFSRLWKNKLFWGEMIFMFALGVWFAIAGTHIVQTRHMQANLDYILNGYPMIIGFICAFFCGIFGGTEYSDGTIRNKLIAGHTRCSVYLSSLVVHGAEVFLCFLSFLLAGFGLGIPLLGGFLMDGKTVVIMLVGSMVTMLAYAAIFTLISMLCQSRTTGISVCLILFCIMFFSAMYIEQRLEEPEVFEGYTYTADSGEMERVDAEPNPNYLRGTKRKVYEFLDEFLPCCQMYQYMMIDVSHARRMVLYSFSIMIVVTAAGIFVFRKKDVK